MGNTPYSGVSRNVFVLSPISRSMTSKSRFSARRCRNVRYELVLLSIAPVVCLHGIHAVSVETSFCSQFHSSNGSNIVIPQI